MKMRRILLIVGSSFIILSGIVEGLVIFEENSSKSINQPSDKDELDKEHIISAKLEANNNDSISEVDKMGWINELQRDLEAFNIEDNSKELANSALSFSNKWGETTDKAHSDAFFGKKDNADELFQIKVKINTLKIYGNRILDELDSTTKSKDFFIKSNSERITSTISQLKRITSQIIN